MEPQHWLMMMRSSELVVKHSLIVKTFLLPIGQPIAETLLFEALQGP